MPDRGEQLGLFPGVRVKARDCRDAPRPGFADAADIPRLTGHSANLLQRLWRGPVTNFELWDHPELYGRNATHRISDVRLWLERQRPARTIRSRRLSAGRHGHPAQWLYTMEAL